MDRIEAHPTRGSLESTVIGIIVGIFCIVLFLAALAYATDLSLGGCPFCKEKVGHLPNCPRFTP